MRPTTVPAAEHDWHACTTPPPPEHPPGEPWHCPICGQPRHWRRPPRPAAQWVRADQEGQ
jgi:hypothetical protein